MEKKIRVRFAPSPTGGLHLGGIRTALYNYLFAKKFGGQFIVRIEDTDQTRFVANAEDYIFKCLAWCGIVPDESPRHGDVKVPYRQSERKAIYAEYTKQLIDKGLAYYAFDTPSELDSMRKLDPNFQYSAATRSTLKNSLTLSKTEVQKLLDDQTPYSIRIKVEPGEELLISDLIRGDIHFNSSNIDDKVLLKADGMPTYHLAVVVDDFLMQISHVFRGEEWLSSLPIHYLLWRNLFGLENMPQWVHLPLILKPTGKGKLSKRDGLQFGFPIYAIEWFDTTTQTNNLGFKELGFLPEAFINFLALLGWNDGTEQEVFTMHELIEKFDIKHIHKAGAKFDYTKATWFNQQWIKKTEANQIYETLMKNDDFKNTYHQHKKETIIPLIDLVKDRCVLLNDFLPQLKYFFEAPLEFDTKNLKNWDLAKSQCLQDFAMQSESVQIWQKDEIQNHFNQTCSLFAINPKEVLLPLRIALVGGQFGPDVFKIAEHIGQTETKNRVEYFLTKINKIENAD